MKYWRVLSVVLGLCMVVFSGCTIFHAKSDATTAAVTAANKMATIGNFGILDIIAAFACLLAALAMIGWGFGFPTPPKATIACVVCAVGAWTLKAILTTFLWWFVGFSMAALVLGAAVLGWQHLGWIEKMLGKDINRDGKVG